MKFFAFENQGTPTWGVAVAEGFVRGDALCGGRFPTLERVVEDGGLPEIKLAMQTAVIEPMPASIKWLMPVGPHAKIICVGLNYKDHAIEAGREPRLTVPSIFTRLGHAQVPHEAALRMPAESDAFDYEAELAVVIGKGGHKISSAQAPEHIFGYTCFNDGSIRDYQKHSVLAGKNFPQTGAIGPWIVTAESLGEDPHFDLVTTVSGEVRQQGSTRSMIFTVNALIHYISTIIPLSPGDVIATGTPAGVGMGRTPPRWLREGDTVEISISGIGTLRNTVVRG
jgi:2-keto-4-pentenoate hydratase/2-oxohepta-3-ene-1,7-dioic acid hydratase in catechol pathway